MKTKLIILLIVAWLLNNNVHAQVSPGTETPDPLKITRISGGINFDGNAVRKYGGARMTGRIGKLDLGFLDMQTEKFKDNPSENFGELRLKRNVFNQNSFIGGILTSRLGMDGIPILSDYNHKRVFAGFAIVQADWISSKSEIIFGVLFQILTFVRFFAGVAQW